MVDENVDRVHAPGQQPMPERDIEPLWPPDQIGAGTPPWASTASPPSPVPPPVRPGQPPSPADYPSLTGGVPIPGGAPVSGAAPISGEGTTAPQGPGAGWSPPPVTTSGTASAAASGPPPVAAPLPPSVDASGTASVTASGVPTVAASGASAADASWGPDASAWAPPTPAQGRPATPETAGGVPAPQAPQTGPGLVDLDMPFSLDQPVVPVPVTSPRPLTAARTSPGAGEPTQGLARRREDASPVTVADASPGSRPSPHDTVRGPDAPAEADRPGPAADAARPGPGEPAGTDRPGPAADATTPDGPSTGGHETGSRANGIAATNDSPPNGSAGGPANGSAGGPGSTDGGSPANGSAGGGVASGGPVPGGGARMPAESPWAQPPQRPAAAAAAAGPGPGAAGQTPASQAAEPGQVSQQYPSQRGPADQGPHPWHPGEQAPPQTDALHGPSPQGQAGQDPPVGTATDLGADPAAPQQAAPPGPYPPQQAAPPGPYPPSQAGPYPPQQGAPPPGPYPPGWYPPPWPQATPGGPAPQQAYQPAEGVTAVPPAQPDATWHPAITDPPTAEDFARRRQVRPADPVATMGVRAVVNRMGLRLPPGRHEQEVRRDIETVRRNFGGLRQVTVVNPKGGAGKTVAILLLAMTFGQKRGGYVLAWDNNETQGTLGMRAQQDFHSRTVRDMLRDLGQFQGAHGRVGDLSQYVRSQGEGMFDVLASDESATGGEMLTAAAFAEIREVVSRFYKLIFVDTGNNVRAQNWQAAMDATDQLVVTMSARNDSAETAARMLDHLEQSGRQRLVRQAVTVVSMPPSRKEIDLPAIQEHFAARTRAVLLAPYERLIDTGEPIRYGGLSAASRDAWLKIAAAVAEGL